MPMNSPTPSSRFLQTCPKLRSKEMYHDAPGQEDAAFASGLYWCMKTHETFGPDGQPADKEHCCEGRACFGG